MKTLRPSACARRATVGITAAGALLLTACGAANESAPSAGSRASEAASASGTISGAGAARPALDGTVRWHFDAAASA